jgi:hypothetical protein
LETDDELWPTGPCSMRACRHLTLLVSLWVLGCEGNLGPGIKAFEQAKYPEALRELEHGAEQFPGRDPREAARYALYRGLTHLALGNAPLAEHWLARVRTMTARDSALLDADERGRLHAAWRSMGHMPGDL